jgi:hypothetical protein|tara:strand:- start:2906 stop:3013 length:108 start_codon:yes stop_codon:yes gene_type:complete
MGFNPNKEYRANKTDYINIIFAVILTVAVVIWALN